MPGYLTPYIITFLSLVIAASLAAIASSESLPRETRSRGVLALGGVFALWLPAVIWMSSAGVFRSTPSELSLALPLVLAGPPLLLLAGLELSAGFRRFARGLAQNWLTGIQGLRIAGGIFLLLWADSALPWEFALPAGLGDVAVGLIAIIAVGRLNAGAADASRWVRFTNVAGLADFAVAIATGFLTAPNAVQFLALDRPNLLVQAFPLALIPAFAVPLFICAHILSMRIQSQERERTGGKGSLAT